MALIKCPECGKEVSDKAVACIHCGYPLGEVKSDLQVSNTKMIAHSDFNSIKPMYVFSQDDEKVNIECGNCEKVYKFDKKYFSSRKKESVISDKAIVCPNCHNGVSAGTKILSKNSDSWVHKYDGSLRCPKCSSTAVTTGARGYSLIWGFLGSGGTVNRCGKCGYKWKPGK